MLSLLILDPQDTVVVFEANGHLTHQWSLDVYVYSTKKTTTKRRKTVSFKKSCIICWSVLLFQIGINLMIHIFKQLNQLKESEILIKKIPIY